MQIPLKSQLRTIRTTLTLAQASSVIWLAYIGGDIQRPALPYNHQFDSFFRFDSDVHLRNLIQELCALFSRGADAISLASVVKRSAIDGKRLQNLTARLTALRVPVRKIQALKNTLSAHAHNSATWSGSYAEAALCRADIERVLNESIGIFNELAELLFVPAFEPDNLIATDISRLLAYAGTPSRPKL
jgi:hypothetical protein